MGYPQWLLEGIDLIIGSGFCLGILIMNFPQHYQCWKHKSADGLSLGYILFCTISNVTLCLASLVGDYNDILSVAFQTKLTPTNTTALLDLDASATDSTSRYLFSLEEIEGEDNFPPGLLRIMQVLNACMPTIQNFLCVLVGVPSLIFYYFMWSRPRPREPVQELPSRPDSEVPLLATLPLEQEPSTLNNSRLYYSDGTEHRMAKFFTGLTLFICFCCTGLAAWVLSNQNALLESWLLQVFGSTAAVTNMILYIPQIMVTHRNQHEGVLSLASLLISAIGDCFQAIFWIFGAQESIWVYGTLASDASMQFILIAMIINFRKQRFQQEQSEPNYEYVHDNSEVDDSECEMPRSEVEVVFGDVFEIFAESGMAKFLDKPYRESFSSTILESLEGSEI
jgi:uncharacterized protein with PQ loop repeat